MLRFAVAIPCVTSVSNFLQSVTSMHCSNNTKEVDILDRCGLPLMWVKLRVFNTAIYENIVRCFFKSCEQCSYMGGPMSVIMK